MSKTDLSERKETQPRLIAGNWRQSRRSVKWWIWTIVFVAVLVIAAGLGYVTYHAEAIIKSRVIETLSARFDGPVDLREFHVSVSHGLQVSGAGLKIFGASDPNPQMAGMQPLIAVDEFRFSASIINLLHTPMHIHRVFLKNLVVNIPPRRPHDGAFKHRRIKIFVDDFVCDQAALVINTLKPGKLPFEFSIGKLDMQDIGPGQPLQFTAALTNPKPVGEIHSTGLFGPWLADDPRNSPVKGKYTFTNADLSTIKGIGGILSSTGEYAGTLGNIAVDGETDTPDFRIRISGHPVPLHTEFHAIVDGTNGDTYLEPVKAKIMQSSLVAKGSIVRVKDPHGHRIVLEVTVNPARIEDLLQLGVRTDPPVMTGAAQLQTKFELSPGEGDVSDRLKLDGRFHISGAHFSNEKIENKVDSLSLRSQGKPKEAKEADPADVFSEMNGSFRLANGLLSFSKLHYEIPGTNVDLTGKYSLDGNQFDFHGTARMDAKLSHMVTGWKSILLKPVDPFFTKHGAGTELPVKVTGTKSAPHFGLDFGHKKDDNDD